MYSRKQYLNQLIAKKDNGQIKIITGLRRCGKSVLLLQLYRDWLLSQGISANQIISVSLDALPNARYRNPIALDKHLRDLMKDEGKRYYVFLDEIQFVADIQNPFVDDPQARITFVDVVLGLMQMENVDVYVTGSNSKMLSSDILTQFRGRGDEIRLYPLSYAEFHEGYEGDKRKAWQEYFTYGGMPRVWSLPTHEERSKYLKQLFEQTYLRDIEERHSIKNDKAVLSALLNILASGIGSLTSPHKLSKTFKSERNIAISPDTIERYLGYFRDSFLMERALRYDVKGKKYIATPAKFYYADLGLRNALLDFRQIEENRIMENILYND
ncbi:MAG: ATP-binding protein, partial [Candidatus Enteromonas sp.]